VRHDRLACSSPQERLGVFGVRHIEGNVLRASACVAVKTFDDAVGRSEHIEVFAVALLLCWLVRGRWPQSTRDIIRAHNGLEGSAGALTVAAQHVESALMVSVKRWGE
jgi:hypothetical protein